ncbi:hypothetical protein HYW76_01655 [Candidatus Pacearchaeota archaeon]|nr:hypothetical protein [Candidatus Pacearchaeota archaeon]
MNYKKRGLSPVIATVLLVLIVIILAVIVYFWAMSFVGESVTKRGAPADQRCEEIRLEFSKNVEGFTILNTGNIPVYQVETKSISGGSVKKELSEVLSLTSGKSAVIGEDIIGEDFSGEITVTPIIMGEVEAGKRVYTCKNSFKFTI